MQYDLNNFDMKIGFVILCYGQYELTVECINRITKLEMSDSVEVIIVDNASPDKSGLKLKDKFNNAERIHVLLNDKNEGYAKGNNIGYIYAINNVKCDCIVIMNNDVFIDDVTFTTRLKKLIINNKDVSVIGPDIQGDHKKHQNPLWIGKFSRKNAIGGIITGIASNLLLHLHINYFKFKKKKKEAYIEPCNMYNIMLHGACIIYCNDWINNEKRAFCPVTFLFGEELFLYNYAGKKHYKTAYFPDLYVHHLGDASIIACTQSERKKLIMRNNNQIKSLFKYLRYEKNIECMEFYSGIMMLISL